MYREDRTTAVAAYFVENAGGAIEHKKLMKLLFFAEAEEMIATGLPLMGGHYVSMADGPVVGCAYDTMKSKGEHELWDRYLTPIQDSKIGLRKSFPFADVLTEKQVETIKGLWTQFGGMTEDEIIAESHKRSYFVDPSNLKNEDGTERKTVPILHNEIIESGELDSRKKATMKRRAAYRRAMDAFASPK